VRNIGERYDATVVQVYAGRANTEADQPVKKLCGFRRVELAAGARARVELAVPLRELAAFDEADRCWRVPGVAWRIAVGSSSDPADLRNVDVALPERQWSVAGQRI